jgi:GH15 family glucan-1,4-alpha-glucosidase
MQEYPSIASHGLVGDLQTNALVSTDGTIDWWCAPRFDSPSIFAALLDTKRGGHCRLSVVGEEAGTDEDASAAGSAGSATEQGQREGIFITTSRVLTRMA